MDDLIFEWDPNKAESNAKKHGVTFEMAREVFEFDYLELPDEGHSGEVRFNVIGATRRGVILFVITTDRVSRIRIISARQATRHEAQKYFEYLAL